MARDGYLLCDMPIPSTTAAVYADKNPAAAASSPPPALQSLRPIAIVAVEAATLPALPLSVRALPRCLPPPSFQVPGKTSPSARVMWMKVLSDCLAGIGMAMAVRH